MSVLQCGRFRVDLSQPQVMAIINLTDDSFSGDGLHGDVRAALARAEHALEQGADMINDINAFRAPGATEVVASGNAGLCLMHMRGEPRTMQQDPRYDDVVGEVMTFLDEQVAALQAAGVARERLVLDPGFGFGKRTVHNFTLLRELARFTEGGLPVLAGMSRKSMIGAVTGREVGERLAGSVAAALIAVQRGAGIVRVHDVAATVDAIKVWQATLASS